MALQVGMRLGPYEIVAPVGAGGMGEVYRARDTRLRREVAVKVLPAGVASEGEALRRFEQEARAVAALNHPNLLTVHDFGKTDAGLVYIVAELLEGATLRQKLSGGALSQRQAVEYGSQMARGLAAAHDKGIVHRDLKPENIFCCEDGRVKILDFGLAKLVEQATGEEKTVAVAGTAAGAVLGTVGYMAPEQARGQGADVRSDIFSLGCVLYEMLAGRRAFRGDSAVDVISAILREEPAEIEGKPGLERIVRHCLEKEPKQRFQSASDVAFSLSDLSTSSGMGSGVGTLPAAASERGWARRLGFAGVGMAGLILAVGLTWALRPARPLPHFSRITFQQGPIASARFLPDGQNVLGTAAWNSGAPGQFSLFSSRLDTPGAQPLFAADDILAVGPGEAAILQNAKLLTGYAEYGTLAVMPLSGGAPRPILDNVEFADYAPGSRNLAVTRYHPDTATFTLEYPAGHVLVTASGWIGDPRFSRDGRHIAFQMHPDMGDDMGYVAMVDLRGHEKILTRRYASTRGLAWAPDDRAIWFSASDTLRMALRAVTLAGHDRLLLETPGALRLEDVLPDGRALVTEERQRIGVDLVTPTQPAPRELTVLDWSNHIIVSADGHKILVGDEAQGQEYGTYLRKPDGSPPVRLGDGDPLALSPDGQWAVSVLPSNLQLELLPIGAGEPRQLTHGAITFLTAYGTWLPDGKAILVAGKEAGRSPRDYLVDLNGTARPVTPGGVVGSVLTPDGAAVLARSLGGSGAGVYNALYPLAGGPPRPVHGLPLGDVPLGLAPGGDWVYVRTTCPGEMCSDVSRVNWDTGQRQLVFTARPDGTAGIRGFGVMSLAADGRTYGTLYDRDLDALYLVTGLR